jgi:hypothetical protein
LYGCGEGDRMAENDGEESLKKASLPWREH